MSKSFVLENCNIESYVSSILERCFTVLKSHYKERLQDLILYGSSARNQMTEESDIDLLVVLNSPMNYFDELRVIIELIYPLQLDSPHWISIKPATTEEFEAGAIQLYRNIQSEGIIYAQS